MLACTSSKTVAGSSRGWVVRSGVDRRSASGEVWAGAGAFPREKRHCIVQGSGEKSANLLACVNGKTRCGSIQTMKFLGSSNTIHSP
jgi:hypothetical protein